MSEIFEIMPSEKLDWATWRLASVIQSWTAREFGDTAKFSQLSDRGLPHPTWILPHAVRVEIGMDATSTPTDRLEIVIHLDPPKEGLPALPVQRVPLVQGRCDLAVVFELILQSVERNRIRETATDPSSAIEIEELSGIPRGQGLEIARDPSSGTYRLTATLWRSGLSAAEVRVIAEAFLKLKTALSALGAGEGKANPDA